MNIIKLSTAILLCGLIFSCGSSNRPKNTIDQFTKEIALGNYKKAVTYIEGYKAETTETKLMAVMLEQTYRINSIKNIKIISESINKGGETAVVTIDLIHKNATSTKKEVKLVKINNEWKISDEMLGPFQTH